MAKKKSQSSRGASASSGKSAGLVIAVGLACAGGGYFAGKNSEAIEPKFTALFSREKSDSAPAKPAAEARHADAPTHAVKPADKFELARILKGGDSRSAEKSSEPKAAADIPMPPAKPETAAAEAPKAEPVAARPVVSEQPAPLAFALVDRDIAESAEDGERVTLSLNFENLAGKPIRAFEGVVKFTDPQDNAIYSSKISVSALISENGTLHWEQHVDAKRLDGKGKRLVSEDKANLRAVFLLKRIFFVDGSVQRYAMPAKAAQAG
ncbi:MAG: hypothetical protein CTY15_03375 [Methylocystis sp.]|nr:MAG: hypothetical protein CTY15_03375 [Methylocystis sp.]